MPRKVIDKVLDTVEETVNGVEKEVGTLMEPVSRSVFSRFPTLFLLLVTFGVVAVTYGFERIITNIKYLNDRPALILLIGVFVLVGTGKLYKKLG